MRTLLFILLCSCASVEAPHHANDAGADAHDCCLLPHKFCGYPCVGAP